MSERMTPERIRQIVGRLSEDRVLQILDTGANEQELIRAKMLAVQQDLGPDEIGGLRTEVVHALYDILRADLIEREEE